MPKKHQLQSLQTVAVPPVRPTFTAPKFSLHGVTSMSAIRDQQHTCPKCGVTLPLSVFKLRSRSQNRAPSWCKACRNSQDRVRRARQRIRLLSECLRRIRFSTPPERVGILFAAATHFAGGMDLLAHRLESQLRSRSRSVRLSAAKLMIKLALTAESLEIMKNSAG